MKLHVVLFACITFFSGLSAIADDPDTAKATDSLNVQSFDKVWSLVKERHWDEEAVGETWDQAREELRPKALQAEDKDATRKVIGELIGRLKQSHFSVVPEAAFEEIEDGKSDTDGYAGLVIRERENELVITQIHKGSPAESSVLRPGWTLQKLGKATDKKLIDVATEVTKEGPMRRETMVGILGDKRFRGEVGETLVLGCTDLDGKEHEVELTLAKAPGTQVKLGNFPTMQVAITSDVSGDGIGYFRFSSFFDPQRMMTAYDETLSKSENGLIIDLRGNYGGLVILPPAMGSRLTGEQGALGKIQMKGAKINLILNPWPEPYSQPVAVLTDECSISAAEILAGGLKDLKLARIFGARTAGLVLPSTFERLPNGDGIQYAFADYQSASGNPLEGGGVTPDEDIDLTKEAFKKHSDPVLARAREWIQAQSK